MKVITNGVTNVLNSGSSKPFDEIKISIREHNKLFPNRKRNIGQKYKYFINEDVFVMSYQLNLFVKILNSISIPVLICLQGIPETIKDIKDLWINGGGTYRDSCHKSAESHQIIYNTIFKK